MREAAYKGLVRHILEYGSSVWDPHYEGLIDDLEKVQKEELRNSTPVMPEISISEAGIINLLKNLKPKRQQGPTESNLSFCKNLE